MVKIGVEKCSYIAPPYFLQLFVEAFFRAIAITFVGFFLQSLMQFLIKNLNRVSIFKFNILFFSYPEKHDLSSLFWVLFWFLWKSGLFWCAYGDRNFLGGYEGVWAIALVFALLSAKAISGLIRWWDASGFLFFYDNLLLEIVLFQLRVVDELG